MRLYHVREFDRGGALDARDEEECFTSVGRRIGVFLTTEPAADGPLVHAAEVDVDAIADYEVSGEGDEHRCFVVPGDLVAELFATA